MKKGVFGALMFIGGLFLGAGAAYAIGYKKAENDLSEKYAKLADDEISSIKKQCEAVCEIHRQSYRAAEEKMNVVRGALVKASDDPITKELDKSVQQFNSDIKDGVKRADNMAADEFKPKPEKAPKGEPGNEHDYTKYSKKNKKKGDISYAKDEVVDTPEGKIIPPREKDRIELITKYDYENDTTYDQIELTYWRGNSILVDGMSYECSIDETIGYDALDHFGDEIEGELFVRNNHDEIDYHVYLEYGIFEPRK